MGRPRRIRRHGSTSVRRLLAELQGVPIAESATFRGDYLRMVDLDQRPSNLFKEQSPAPPVAQRQGPPRRRSHIAGSSPDAINAARRSARNGSTRSLREGAGEVPEDRKTPAVIKNAYARPGQEELFVYRGRGRTTVRTDLRLNPLQGCWGTDGSPEQTDTPSKSARQALVPAPELGRAAALVGFPSPSGRVARRRSTLIDPTRSAGQSRIPTEGSRDLEYQESFHAEVGNEISLAAPARSNVHALGSAL
jgi:hypothetical protein